MNPTRSSEYFALAWCLYIDDADHRGHLAAALFHAGQCGSVADGFAWVLGGAPMLARVPGVQRRGAA